MGAIALAGLRANAIGAVRINLAPEGIEVELIRVAAFSDGFAPGSIAHPIALRAPYTAVRALTRQGSLLYLALDPAVVMPHNRFALAGFSDDPADALAAAFRARLRVRWASQLVPLPLGVIAALLVPHELATGVLGRASVGALVALAALGLLRELWSWHAWGGPRSERLRDRFEAELASRLALIASAVARPVAPVLAARMPPRRRPHPPLPPRALLDPGAQGPLHARAALAASLPPPRAEPSRALRPLAAALAAACCVVAVMAFVGRFATGRAALPAIDRAETGLGAAARSVRASALPDSPERARCVCTRADSPLWREGVPTLAVLTFHGEEEPSSELAPTLDSSGKSRFDFDLAVVNDSSRPLRDVRVTLTFARRTPAGKRVGAVDRGLFWAGALAPGAAVKWRVTAPGSEQRTDVSVTGTLDEAHLAPAPPDAFYKLLSSKFRAVRLHGAAMLAYLRDPRADAAARSLQASGGVDAQLVAAIARTAAPVFACDVRAVPDADPPRREACIFNGSSKRRARLSVREVRADGAAQIVPLDVVLPVHEGRRIAAAFSEDGGGELEIIDPEGG